jgi:predicted Zn-dependent peptidase
VSLDGAKPQLDKVEKAVWDVLYDLGKKPISERELTRAKNQVAARSLRQLQNIEELATELAFWEMRGGWNYINKFPDLVQKVTAEQVQEACRKYFYRKNSTVGVILPEEEEKVAGKIPAAAATAAGKRKAAPPGGASASDGGAE